MRGNCILKQRSHNLLVSESCNGYQEIELIKFCQWSVYVKCTYYLSVNSDYFTSCAYKYELDIGKNIVITIVTILHKLDTAVHLRAPSLTHINKLVMGLLERRPYHTEICSKTSPVTFPNVLLFVLLQDPFNKQLNYIHFFTIKVKYFVDSGSVI